MKPILFNSEMVRAIMDGRKTVTRRAIKPQPWCDSPRDCGCTNWNYGNIDTACPAHCISTPNAHYHLGDILWVRETWYKDIPRYMYRANYNDNEKFYKAGKEVVIKWRPSIHMPREAARLFLRVIDVLVERLQDITPEEVEREGIDWVRNPLLRFDLSTMGSESKRRFAPLWDSTIKPADLPLYGWEANPWVWVIEFERISKEEKRNEIQR